MPVGSTTPTVAAPKGKSNTNNKNNKNMTTNNKNNNNNKDNNNNDDIDSNNKRKSRDADEEEPEKLPLVKNLEVRQDWGDMFDDDLEEDDYIDEAEVEDMGEEEEEEEQDVRVYLPGEEMAEDEKLQVDQVCKKIFIFVFLL